MNVIFFLKITELFCVSSWKFVPFGITQSRKDEIHLSKKEVFEINKL